MAKTFLTRVKKPKPALVELTLAQVQQLLRTGRMPESKEISPDGGTSWIVARSMRDARLRAWSRPGAAVAGIMALLMLVVAVDVIFALAGIKLPGGPAITDFFFADGSAVITGAAITLSIWIMVVANLFITADPLWVSLLRWVLLLAIGLVAQFLILGRVQDAVPLIDQWFLIRYALWVLGLGMLAGFSLILPWLPPRRWHTWAHGVLLFLLLALLVPVVLAWMQVFAPPPDAEAGISRADLIALITATVLNLWALVPPVAGLMIDREWASKALRWCAVWFVLLPVIGWISMIIGAPGDLVDSTSGWVLWLTISMLSTGSLALLAVVVGCVTAGLAYRFSIQMPHEDHDEEDDNA